jgi:hypothetical protein
MVNLHTKNLNLFHLGKPWKGKVVVHLWAIGYVCLRSISYISGHYVFVSKFGIRLDSDPDLFYQSVLRTDGQGPILKTCGKWDLRRSK